MALFTPDRRYLIVRDRLWRASNPQLTARARASLTRDLMSARRAVASARRDANDTALRAARKRVNAAKIALGERGPVWWSDGAPDFNRRLVQNTPYAAWFERLRRYREAILELLAERGPTRSICPSDVARREEKEWRKALDDVRAAGRWLAEDGEIRVTQGAAELDPAADWKGPVRFRLPA